MSTFGVTTYQGAGPLREAHRENKARKKREGKVGIGDGRRRGKEVPQKN